MTFYKTLRINKIYEYQGIWKIYGYAIHEKTSYLIVAFKNDNIDISSIKVGESSRLGLEKNAYSDFDFKGEQVILREVK